MPDYSTQGNLTQASVRFHSEHGSCQNETLKASTAFWRLSTSPEAPVCQSRLRARGMPLGAACLLVAPAASSLPPAKQKVQRLEDVAQSAADAMS